MDALVAMEPERRRRLCDEAGHLLGLSAGSVEKDFWACWILRLLFGLPAAGPHLTFKGGTSLSRGWKLIQRFSEDLDEDAPLRERSRGAPRHGRVVHIFRTSASNCSCRAFTQGA